MRIARNCTMFRFLLLIWLTIVGMSAALADSDQDRARRAVQAGTVRPLAEILAVVQRRYPGRVLDAGMGQAGGHYFYDIRLLDGGRVTELRVDAGSAAVMDVRDSGRRDRAMPADRDPRMGRASPLSFERESGYSSRGPPMTERRGGPDGDQVGRGRDQDKSKGRGRGGGRD